MTPYPLHAPFYLFDVAKVHIVARIYKFLGYSDSFCDE